MGTDRSILLVLFSVEPNLSEPIGMLQMKMVSLLLLTFVLFQNENQKRLSNIFFHLMVGFAVFLSSLKWVHQLVKKDDQFLCS